MIQELTKKELIKFIQDNNNFKFNNVAIIYNTKSLTEFTDLENLLKAEGFIWKSIRDLRYVVHPETSGVFVLHKNMMWLDVLEQVEKAQKISPILVFKYKEEQVSFSSAQDLWKYLVEGGEVITSWGYRYKFHEGFLHRKDPKNSSFIKLNLSDGLNFTSDYCFKPYFPPSWYDNIPKQGILCWVDTTELGVKDKIYVDIILKKENGLYKSAAVFWQYAIPLTEEEVKTFIYNYLPSNG